MFTIRPLTQQFARAHAVDILRVKNRIPTPPWTTEVLLSSCWMLKDGRTHGLRKWERSYVALSRKELIGVILCYERWGVPSTPHSGNALFIQSIAVAEGWEGLGIGQLLVLTVVADLKGRGLLTRGMNTRPENKVLLPLTTQTSKDPSNEGVLRFYQKLGFLELGELTNDRGEIDIVLIRWMPFTRPRFPFQ